MLYPGLVTWMSFVIGLVAGGLIVGLWMRARIVRLEAAKQFADTAALKLNETFQALADTALRSNQASFLEAAHAQMTGDIAQKQTAIEGVVRPLTDSLERLQTQVRELERAREKAY